MTFSANTLASITPINTNLPGNASVTPSVCIYKGEYWVSYSTGEGPEANYIVASSSDGKNFQTSKSFTSMYSGLPSKLLIFDSKLWLFYPVTSDNGYVTWWYSTLEDCSWSKSIEVPNLGEIESVLNAAVNTDRDEESIYVCWTVEGLPGSYSNYVMTYSTANGWSRAYVLDSVIPKTQTTPSLISYKARGKSYVFLAGPENNNIYVSHITYLDNKNGEAICSLPVNIPTPPSIEGYPDIVLFTASNKLYCFYGVMKPLEELQADSSENGVNWSKPIIEHRVELPSIGYSIYDDNGQKKAVMALYTTGGLTGDVNLIIYDYE